jgi:hypothetical protein
MADDINNIIVNQEGVFFLLLASDSEHPIIERFRRWAAHVAAGLKVRGQYHINDEGRALLKEIDLLLTSARVTE